MKTLRLKEFPVLLQRLASGEVAGSPIRAACVFFVLKSEVGDYCRKVQLFIITARSCDPPPLPNSSLYPVLIMPPSEEEAEHGLSAFPLWRTTSRTMMLSFPTTQAGTARVRP